MGGWIALGELAGMIVGLGLAWYFLGRHDRPAAAATPSEEASGPAEGAGGPDRPG